MPVTSHEVRPSLDRTVVEGLAWTAAAKWTAQLLSWASTLVVARILTPADYGVVGMALVFLGLVQLFSDFGLGSAIIHMRRLEASPTRQLAALSTLLGLVLGILAAAASPLVAALFREPRVATVVLALSLTFPVTGMQVIARAVLVRELRFRLLAALESGEAVASILITVTVALLGGGYWALVAGNIGGRLIGALLTITTANVGMEAPRDWGTIVGPLRFGAQMVLASFAWYAFSNADFAIVGRALGKEALGAYTIGWTLASIPIEKVNAIVGRVATATFSAVQDDTTALRRYFLRLTEGIALAAVPAAVGLALVADDFVLGVLGPQWSAAITPLRLLALAATVRSLGPVSSHLLVATGHPSKNTQFSIAGAVVMPPCFILASMLAGIDGVAAVWLFVLPFIMACTAYRHAFAIAGVQLVSYLRAVWPSAAATVVMALAVLVIRLVIGQASAARLAVSIAVGAIAYVGCIALFWRDRLGALWMLFRARSTPPDSGVSPMTQ